MFLKLDTIKSWISYFLKEITTHGKYGVERRISHELTPNLLYLPFLIEYHPDYVDSFGDVSHGLAEYVTEISNKSCFLQEKDTNKYVTKICDEFQDFKNTNFPKLHIFKRLSRCKKYIFFKKQFSDGEWEDVSSLLGQRSFNKAQGKYYLKWPKECPIIPPPKSRAAENTHNRHNRHNSAVDGYQIVIFSDDMCFAEHYPRTNFQEKILRSRRVIKELLKSVR